MKRLLYISVMLCAMPVCGQVTLLSPTGDGGFESGGTFAANNWTVVQNGGGAANKWYLGTAALQSGARSAYISNDGGTTNQYTVGQARTQHLYYDITFPAATTTVTIQFDWRGYGESCCDYLEVFLENQTFTPVAGTSNPSTNQIGNTYNLSSTWQTATINLNCGGYAGTSKRLIFTWRDDASLGTQPPAALDNVSVVAQTSGTVCSYSVASITYNPDPFNSGTALNFPDDEHSAAIPIGFTFCFNGTNYTQCVVSSNAYLAFDPSLVGSYSQWDTDPIFLSTPTYLLNTIMFPWHDVDPSVSGTIKYSTYGTAPSRRFVVAFRNVAMFDCTSLLYTGEVILYETTNEIEMHIKDKTVCTSWNNEEAVEGLNLSCSAVTVPGRNNTSWSVSNDAYRFTPTGCCTTVLPVEWLDFYGYANGSSNEVEWNTGDESHNDYFTVERSQDGFYFDAIGTRESRGFEENRKNYTWIDPAPFFGITYYRIRQTDLDGHYTFSKIISIRNEGKPVLSVFPNPARDQLSVQLSDMEGNFTVRILDMSSRTLISDYDLHGKESFNIDISGLPKGIYSLQIQQGSEVHNSRFIRE